MPLDVIHRGNMMFIWVGVLYCKTTLPLTLTEKKWFTSAFVDMSKYEYTEEENVYFWKM